MSDAKNLQKVSVTTISSQCFNKDVNTLFQLDVLIAKQVLLPDAPIFICKCHFSPRFAEKKEKESESEAQIGLFFYY